MSHKDIEKLRRWFLAERRALPWRDNPTPYAVWVSEVMLQQTQVSVVVPYFERWMQQFPTIEALAAAPVEQVIKAWEGLGYYSRARNLHAGAQYVVDHHGGQLPSDADALRKIKGLGDYTIGAIRAFAFRRKAAAVDGNVLRVVARYANIDEDITKVSTRRRITETVEAVLPDKAPWEVTEALIELGATACSKQPRCLECPLQSSCEAHRHGRQHALPIKKKGPAPTPLYRAVAVAVHNGAYLVVRGASGKVMADLYEFPYWDTGVQGWAEPQLLDAVRERYGVFGELLAPLPKVEHGFTRYRVTLQPYLIAVDSRTEGDWHTIEQLEQLPFSSGHRRVLNHLAKRPVSGALQ